MNTIKKKMISKAKKQFKNIYPCAYHKQLKDCFTVADDKMIFWFNTDDESTHVVMHKLKKKA